MQHKVFFNIFLLYSSAISAMKLATTNSSHIQTIPDKLSSTAICLRLDRPAQDTLRCTCKKDATLILSQDEYTKREHERKAAERARIKQSRTYFFGSPL